MKVIALVDADILAYQAAAASEQPIKWDDNLWTLHAFEDEAERRFDEMLERIKTAVEADEVVIVLSDDVNWRKGVLPTYKGNRAATRKPMLLKHLKDRALEQFDAFQRSGLEGDDCLGILQTRKGAGNTIICSLDKDFKTIPGKHYNFGKQQFFEITQEEADYWHLMQTLMGDTTDGYGGCPGIGADTAAELLSNPVIFEQTERILKSGPRKGQAEKQWTKRPLAEGETLWDMVVSCFRKAGLGEEEALVQARVARICRASDYNFKDKEVILWTPKN